MPSLAEIRAKLMEQDKKRDFQPDNAVYPFWDIPEGKPATVRLLPDGDPNAEYFWAQRLVIRLPFPYVKGQNDARPVTVQVPCLDMWPDLKGRDPIISETKTWWDNPELVDLARKYYKKKSFVFQGLITDNPLTKDAENAPENPIRRLIINPTMFEIIKSCLMNPEVDVIPTDYERGRDFRIVRTKRGQYSDYTTSNWSMRERALSEKEREAVERFGLFNLSEFTPQKPSERHIEAIREMFHASLEEQPYDPEQWAEFYKPFGINSDTSSTPTGQANQRPTQTAKPATETVSEAKPATDDAPEERNLEDALSRLRNRSSSDKASAAEQKPSTAPSKGEDTDMSAKAILDAIRTRSANS